MVLTHGWRELLCTADLLSSSKLYPDLLIIELKTVINNYAKI